MKNLSKKEALAVYNETNWAALEKNEIVAFQLFQERMCVPDFWDNAEKVFGRPILNVQIRKWPIFRDEFVKKFGAPNLDEIWEKIKSAQKNPRSTSR